MLALHHPTCFMCAIILYFLLARPTFLSSPAAKRRFASSSIGDSIQHKEQTLFSFQSVGTPAKKMSAPAHPIPSGPPPMAAAWAKFERLLSLSGISFAGVAREEGGARMSIIRSVNGGPNRAGAAPPGIPTYVFTSPLARGALQQSRTVAGGSSAATGGTAPALNAKLALSGSTVDANDSAAAPLTLTPLEVALVSAQWNRLYPPAAALNRLADDEAATAGTHRHTATAAVNTYSHRSGVEDPASGVTAVPGGYLVEPTHVRPHHSAATNELLETFRAHALGGRAAPALSVAAELMQRDAAPLCVALQDYLPHVSLAQMQEVLCLKPATAATLAL